MRRTTLQFIVGTGALLVGAGWGSASWVDVATFNTGLNTGFVPLAEERAWPVAEALAALEADAVCVQEMLDPTGEEDHVAWLLEATAHKWPTALSIEPDPGEPFVQPCGTDPAFPAFYECVMAACAGVPDDQLTGCVLTACGEPFASLDAQCLNCLETQVGVPLAEAVGLCVYGQADRYAWGGDFGLWLFTKGQVHAQDTLVFDSTITRQGAIYADVTLPGFGRTHVFCFHPSAVLGAVPYPGPGSWVAENAAQVQALLDWVEEKTHGTGPVLLLGDYNSGPELPGLVPELPEVYGAFLDAGFENPYADSGTAQCTWCPENSLVADDDVAQLLDHVLVRDTRRQGFGQRILMDPVTVYVGEEEVPVTTHLSDHYGLRLRLVPEGVACAPGQP